MVRRIDGIVEQLNTDNGKIGLWSRDLLMCNSSIFFLSFLAFQLLFVQLGGGWKKENEVEGTWTRFRDCADSCNSFVQTCTTVSAKHLTAKKERQAKTVFERLYLVVGLRKFAPWVNCPCAATPPLFGRQLFLDFCETTIDRWDTGKRMHIEPKTPYFSKPVSPPPGRADLSPYTCKRCQEHDHVFLCVCVEEKERETHSICESVRERTHNTVTQTHTKTRFCDLDL